MNNKVAPLKDIKLAAIAAAVFLFLAVGLGAFGAHGLEGRISERALTTWQTGVTYQFYHGLALLGLAALSARFQGLKLSLTYGLFILGVVLFSFNCYLYAVTGIKTFAMIVPLGGFSFLAGWALAIRTIIRDLK